VLAAEEIVFAASYSIIKFWHLCSVFGAALKSSDRHQLCCCRVFTFDVMNVAELPSRRHSSLVSRSSGGVVKAALRRKAASFDSTLESVSSAQIDLPVPFEVPCVVEQKVCVVS
jgi:hypothetical protein